MFNDVYTPEQLDKAKATIQNDVEPFMAALILVYLILSHPEVPVPSVDEADGDPIEALLGLVDEYPNEIAEATLYALYEVDPFTATLAAFEVL